MNSWKRWVATALFGSSASLLVYACVVPNEGAIPTAQELQRTIETTQVPGSIQKLAGSLVGSAATQIAIDRLDELEYLADDLKDCDGDGKREACCDYHGHCPPDAYPQQIATAVVTNTSTLSISVANLSNTGALAQVGVPWTDTGTIKKVAVADIDRRLFVVGTRNSNDKLSLRLFSVGAGGPVWRASLHTTISMGDFAIARVPVRDKSLPDKVLKDPNDPDAGYNYYKSNPDDTDVIELAVAYGTTAGLQVTTFKIDRVAESFQQQTTSPPQLSSAKSVAIAVPQRPQGIFATASLGTDSKVTLVAWGLSSDGTLGPRDSTTLAGTYSDVAATGAGYRRMAVYAKGSTTAKLASYDFKDSGSSMWMSLRSDIDSPSPLSGAALVTGGSSRLFLVGKSGSDLKVRSYLSVTSLVALDEYTTSNYGSSPIGMAATVFESSWLIAANVNTSSQLRLDAWRDYHVPVARGFWPSGTLTPVADAGVPGNNFSTFAAAGGISPLDLSIAAANDNYVVACNGGACSFRDKAGVDLPQKYTQVSGAGADIADIFASVVGVPGGSVAEENLLRHLAYQHACDPEQAQTERNRCPTQRYDSSVTYDTWAQKFVIVTQFRMNVGCSDTTGRYPAIAVSKTMDPRDGFFTYVSLETGGRDLPRISAENGIVIVGWNAGGNNRTLGPTAEVFELGDLFGTPAAVPRVTKIDPSQVPVRSNTVPVSARGNAPVGMIIELDTGTFDTRGSVWTFRKKTIGPVQVKSQHTAYPFEFRSGEAGAPPAVVEFTTVGPGLYDGHMYRAGMDPHMWRGRLLDYNYRYASATNDLWLAGTSSQQFGCLHPTSGNAVVCRVYGVAADNKGRMLLNYTSLGRSDTGPDSYAAASYALLQRPLAPPVTAVLQDGDQFNNQFGDGVINSDFALPFTDPSNAGFWTIAPRSKGTGYLASIGRVLPSAVPPYTGVGSLWPTATTTQPATLGPSYTWQDNALPSIWRQFVRGDFDGGSGGLDEIFAYDDKAGEGRFYGMSTTGLQSMQGLVGAISVGTGLYVVALEVCGAINNLCPGNVTNSTRELLFYDWVKGELSFRRIGSNGLVAFGTPDSTRHTWSLITAGDFTLDYGDEVILYDPTSGELQFNSITADGRFTSTMTNQVNVDVAGDATAIVSGDFAADPFDEVYVYMPYRSEGRFFTIASNGLMSQVGDTDSTRGTWGQVYTMGDRSSVLVRYDPSEPPNPVDPPEHHADPPDPATWNGTLRFSKVINGVLTTQNDDPVIKSGYGRNWTNMVAGHFLSSSQEDIFFYRQIAPAP